MNTDRLRRRRPSPVRLSVALLAFLVPAALAVADGVPRVAIDPYPGELGRLYRQAYDYNYRNSNRNVFRSSRHFHPTRNVFRSSGHYRQKLAASYDGYPIRSIVNYDTIRNGRRRNNAVGYTYHRRHPTGPTWYGEPYYGLVEPVFPFVEQEYEEYEEFDEFEEPIEERPPRPRQRWEIETVPIHVEPRVATQRPVLRRVEGPDGRLRTIIESVPIASESAEAEPIEREPLADDLALAWRALADGDHAGAAELFAARSLDTVDGPAATLGYGLARAAAGEMHESSVLLERALAMEAEVLAAVDVDASLRRELETLQEACADREDEDAGVVADVCTRLLAGR